ncbi:MAG: Mammalian cell entry related domain protein [Marmoricola sp.]|nr:Mammalian cell entry related domain protein [Marmoricola sp.]
MSIKLKTAAWAGAGLLAAGLLGHSLLSNGPNSHQVEVVATFADSSPLIAGNVVKASGVNVGRITNIQLKDGKSQVTMVIDKSVLPLHQDVQAIITTQDLLGERFVKLERGTDSSPALSAPYVINASRTSRVVDLQDVLNSVDTPTATALSALLTESGEGVRGQGAKVDATVAGLKPAMTQVKALASILSTQNALLTRLVDSTQPVAAALATSEGKPLDQLVTSATQSLSAVADEREALRASLQQLPQTIANSRAALAELAGVADPATRTLASLRPVTNDLTDISGELQRFANAADPALASLPPVLNQADKLLAQAAPVVQALRPASNSLVPIGSSAKHLSDVALSGQNLTNLMEFVKGWSMATSDYDSISHYFKAIVPLSPNALGDTAAGLLPGLPDNILHGLPVPTSPTLPLPPRTSGPSLTSPNATGLSQTQETNLLSQLLGGLL